jgi:hypothetical protein
MKLRVLLITLLLLAPQTPSISATPPKAGAICSRAGITKNYNGKKYTCVKSGKNLVWDKGKTISTSSPKMPNAPIQSPIPTPSPSKSSDSASTSDIGLNLVNINSTNPFSARPGSTINDMLKISSRIKIQKISGTIQNSSGQIVLAAKVNMESESNNESTWKLTYDLGETVSGGRYVKMITAFAINGRILTFYESPLEIIPLNTSTPTPSTSPSKAKTTNPVFLAYEKIQGDARLQISSKLKEVEIEALNARYLVAPTVSKQIEQIKRNELNIAYTHWKKIFSSNKITIILWDSNSGVWADNTYDEIKGQWNAGSKLSTSAPDMTRCNNAFSANFYNNEDNYVTASCENADFIESSRFKMAHEYTHLVQNYFKMFDGSIRYALWVTEGGAHYYGQIIGFASDNTSINENINNLLANYEFHGGFKPIREYLKNSNETAFVDLMKSIEYSSSSASGLQAAYAFGAFATEYLIGKYGEDKLLNFWREFKNSQNVSTNFSKIYGTNIDDFYKELRGYVNYFLNESAG